MEGCGGMEGWRDAGMEGCRDGMEGCREDVSRLRRSPRWPAYAGLLRRSQKNLARGERFLRTPGWDAIMRPRPSGAGGIFKRNILNC